MLERRAVAGGRGAAFSVTRGITVDAAGDRGVNAGWPGRDRRGAPVTPVTSDEPVTFGVPTAVPGNLWNARKFLSFAYFRRQFSSCRFRQIIATSVDCFCGGRHNLIVQLMETQLKRSRSGIEAGAAGRVP
jgi:hypothetical protein